MLSLKNLIFLDTETTGKENGRLVQLAVMRYGAEKPTTENFKPAEPIGIEAMEVHGITNEEVADLGMFEATEEAKKEIFNSVIVAHNAKFDIGVLAREGVTVDKYIDTMRVAQHLIEAPAYRLQYLRHYLKLNVPKTAAAHDAGGDVLALVELFKYLFTRTTCKGNAGEEIEDAALNEMIALSQKPVLLKTVPFGKHKDKSFADVARTDRSYLDWLIKQPDLSEDLSFTLKHYLK
ncbi:MAG: exonuclease domain-containing protein [Patescibacteria group bacterium]|nr:exonuclease domain-containing protein [Patescibacteria group bacterium]